METALFEMLKKVPGLEAEIGTRIYPIERPQGGKLPAITYQRVSGVSDYDMMGATGLTESRFFIWFYGEKTRSRSAYANAKRIKGLVVDMLTQRPGYTDSIGTTEIQSVIINNESDNRLDDASGKGIVRVQLDCTIWHRTMKG